MTSLNAPKLEVSDGSWHKFDICWELYVSLHNFREVGANAAARLADKHLETRNQPCSALYIDLCMCYR